MKQKYTGGAQLERQEVQSTILGHERDVGICFLTRVSGHFAGSGEYAEINKDDSDTWVLKIGSYQQGVAATAACVKASTAQ